MIDGRLARCRLGGFRFVLGLGASEGLGDLARSHSLAGELAKLRRVNFGGIGGSLGTTRLSDSVSPSVLTLVLTKADQIREVDATRRDGEMSDW